jgi:hypothetical protein
MTPNASETHRFMALIGRTFRNGSRQNSSRPSAPVRTVVAIEKRPAVFKGMAWHVGYTVPGSEAVVWALASDFGRWLQKARAVRAGEQVAA